MAANFVSANLVRQVETRSWGPNPIISHNRRAKGRDIQSLSQPQMTKQLTLLELESPGEIGPTKVRGGRGLSETSPLIIEELPERLELLLDLYHLGADCKEIAAYFHAKKVPRTDALAHQCDEELVALINDGHTDRIQIEPMALRSSESGGGCWSIQYRDFRMDLPELDWNAIALAFVGTSPIQLRHLRDAKLCWESEDSGESTEVSVLSSLTLDLEHQRGMIILIDGYWHLCTQTYLTWLDGEVDRLERIGRSFELPNWGPGIADEEGYNKHVAEELSWICLDRKPWYGHGNLGRFEICDLISDQGALIHVKDLNGTPSVGYVTNQALISARNFALRSDIREHVFRQELEQFGVTISGTRRDVVIALATRSDGALVQILPVGAKVRLVEASGELLSLGLNPVISRVSMEVLSNV